VRRVTEIVGEITQANHEQTSGIEQINIAISQMDHVTQQNAALVEQAAAAAAPCRTRPGTQSGGQPVPPFGLKKPIARGGCR
jgi:methyl-accepting chemotaxis protein